MYSPKPRVHAIPLTSDQWEVVGVTPLFRRYGSMIHSASSERAVYYALTPPLKASIGGLEGDVHYCVDLHDGVVSIIVSEYAASLARAVAALAGLDTLLVVPYEERSCVREALIERGVRYAETDSFVESMTLPFHVGDEEVAVEILMLFDGVEIKRSKVTSGGTPTLRARNKPALPVLHI